MKIGFGTTLDADSNHDKYRQLVGLDARYHRLNFLNKASDNPNKIVPHKIRLLFFYFI